MVIIVSSVSVLSLPATNRTKHGSANKGMSRKWVFVYFSRKAYPASTDYKGQEMIRRSGVVFLFDEAEQKSFVFC